MRQTTQDSKAGRIQPAEFDTVLPPDARAEMLRPKRPVILEPPRVERKVDRSGVLIWVGTVAVVAIILAGVIGHYTQSLKTPAQAQKAAPVFQPTPAPQKPSQEPLAKPQPVSQPLPPPPAVSAPRARLVLYRRWAGNSVHEVIDSTGRTVKILVDPAPRALLANPPAPRAELVQTPGPQIGQAHSFAMPYDGSFEVQGVLRGYLNSEIELPQNGNAIGDTWVVGNTPWVWITTPGTKEPTWIDP